MTQVKQIPPPLRFPYFYKEWECITLSDVLSVSKDRNIEGKYDRHDVFSVAKAGIINQIALKGRSLAGQRLTSYHIVDRDNIVYTKSPLKTNPYGIIKYNANDAGIVSTLYAVYKVQPPHVAAFFDYSFQLDARVNNYLRPLVNKGAKNDMKVSNQSVLRGKIYLPSASEQRKIVDFFSFVDKKISLLEKKKELLEKYKKGVMQQIFSQKIRFKDDNGDDYPEWDDIKLSDVLIERKLHASKGQRYEHVSLTKEGVVPKSKRYERDFLVRQDDKQYKVTKIDDICYNPANLKFNVICRNKYKEAVFSPIYVTFEVVGANPKFIEYLVTRQEFINAARRYEEGTVWERMAVKPSDFLKVQVLLPPTEEQTKIAGFLSCLCWNTETTQLQIEACIKWKKGLLQQMFV